jgi:hypothetical protein
MKKLKVSSKPTRKKIIPMVMGIANTIIKELRFVEIINETVHWDRAHWNISPGGLAKMLALGTLTNIRIPLTHLEDPWKASTPSFSSRMGFCCCLPKTDLAVFAINSSGFYIKVPDMSFEIK